MKKVVKLFSIIIAIFMMFMINVKAEDVISIDTTKQGNTDSNSNYVTNEGTITLTGTLWSDIFEGYKILEVYYNSTSNAFTYEFTTDFKSFLAQSTNYQDFTVEDYQALTSGDITSGSTITTSTLDKLVSEYASYIKKNSITGLELSGKNSTTRTLTTDAGSYLILPTETVGVYAVMVGNITFTAENGAWTLNNPTIVAKKSTVSIGISSGDEPEIIGRDYTTHVSATIPTYPTNATNKKYAIKNTLDDGITFLGLSTISLECNDNVYQADETGTIMDESGNVIATSTFSEQVLTIEFNLDYITSSSIDIYYGTRLNENASIADSNRTVATLIYSNDPYGLETATEDAYLFQETYGLQIYKYDIEDNTPLSGAVFEIYNDEELTDLIGTITTDETGIGRYIGIPGTTVYLKEIKAPSGYKLLNETIILSAIQPTSDTDLYDVTVEVPDGYRMQYIANEKMGLLPVTGGIGTIIYTLIGLSIITGSVFFIKTYKKQV